MSTEKPSKKDDKRDDAAIDLTEKFKTVAEAIKTIPANTIDRASDEARGDTVRASNRYLDDTREDTNRKANITAIEGANLGQLLDDAKVTVGEMLRNGPNILITEGRREGDLPDEAKKQFIDGSWKLVLGNQPEAKKCFRYAEKTFMAAGQNILADVSNGMYLYSSGLDNVFRMKYGDAVDNLEDAKDRFEKILKADVSKVFRKLLEFYTIGVDNYLPYAQAMNSLVRWDFEAASEKFKEAADIIEKKLVRVGELTSQVDPNETFHVNYVAFFEGLHHFVLGLSKLARAHHLSSNENSVEAETLCNKARSDMENARKAFRRSEAPGSGQTFGEACNLIEGQFIPSYVMYYQKQAMRQKEITRLEQERDDLWQAVLGALNMPRTVSVNQVATQLQQNTQIMQNIENAVKDSLRNIKKELLEPLSNQDPEAKQLENECSEVLNIEGTELHRKANNFLDKMKNYALKIHEKATPWIPVIMTLQKILSGS